MLNKPRIGIITLILVVITLMSSAFGQASWVSLDGTAELVGPVSRVVSSNPNETIIQFTVPGFLSDEISRGSETYHSLRLPDHFTTMDAGRPQLPVISEFVAIPAGARVRVSVIDFTETVLSGYRVEPYQRMLLEGESDRTIEIDRNFYQQSTYYPAARAEVGRPGIWRHIDMVNLIVNPLRYNPASAELAICTEITVRLEYVGADGTVARAMTRRPVSRDYDGMYRRSVLNYESLGLPVDDGVVTEAQDTGYDYLIIAAGQYMKNLEPFVEYKNSRGLRTVVVPASQAGEDTASLKAFIADEYEKNGIRYVLLVGNESDIPGYWYYTVAGHEEDTIFCDYYYSLLDGDDEFADIAIGRFSVENAAEVDNLVTKSIVFESNPPRGDWLTKALLVAHREEAPLKYQGCKEEVRTADFVSLHQYDILTPEFTTAYGALPARGGDMASNADVIAAVNDGQRVVNYRGHGSDDYWSYWNMFFECFTTLDVDQFDNGEMTPIIFSIACWNNNLMAETPCLGEAFTRANDAAVACLGSSIPSYTVVNHDYDKAIFGLIFNDGLNTIGDVSNEASVQMIRRYHEDAVQNARGYLWLGDPSLKVIFLGDSGPDAPVLVSPEDGTQLPTPAAPLFDWTDVPGATSYEVVIDDHDDFLSPVAGAVNLTLSQWQAPSLSTGIYYWRARAVDGDTKGAWSLVRGLNVGIETPVLISPADGVVLNNSDSIALVWQGVAGVEQYEIQVDDDPLFASPVFDESVSGAANENGIFYLTPRLPAGTYYWRAKAEGAGLPYSSAWQFIISASSGDLVMHVADMRVECFIDERYHFTGMCSVTVVDQFENPVADAEVISSWEKYNMEGDCSALTNERGIAVLWTRTINDIYAPFCFTVDDITGISADYDPSANLVTHACESGWIWKDGVSKDGGLPEKFSLHQNYPNPFNPSTEITFSLPSASQVRLEVFNISGRRVSFLVDRHLEAGRHSVTWDGAGFASGIYLYRLTTENRTISRKMLLLK